MTVGPIGDTTLAGRYRFERRLGGGGMGSVWKARDLVLGREVAVKSATGASNDVDRLNRRLRLEAAAVGSLDEPRVARVYDFIETDDEAFIVMELVEGESLKARLDREGRLPADEAALIAAQSAEGLGAAHRAGIVHRDVKPSNIMLTETGVKIVDFGIAVWAHAPIDQTAETLTRGVTGTASYIAPERAQGGESTPAADMYALGVVLYQMLAGRLPFDADEPIAILLAHVSAEPIPLPADVPYELADACLRLLSKDPDQRPGPADALAQWLYQFSAPTEWDVKTQVMPGMSAPTMLLGADYADRDFRDMTRVAEAEEDVPPETPLPRRRLEESEAHSRRRLASAPAAFSAVALALVVGFAGWLAANRLDHAGTPTGTAPPAGGSVSAAPVAGQSASQSPATQSATVVQQTSAGKTSAPPAADPPTMGAPAPHSTAASAPAGGPSASAPASASSQSSASGPSSSASPRPSGQATAGPGGQNGQGGSTD